MLGNVTERLSTSRGGAVALGIAAAVLAGILLLVYLDRYRDSVRGETANTPVLVAKSLIIKGTSGTQVAKRDQYQAAELPRDDIKDGAIADPAYLSGRIAVNDILPGQQLTTADFTTAPSTSVTTRLTGPQRGISVTIDNVHGSLSQLTAGSRIDIYIGAGGGPNGQQIVKLFRPNVYVLAVPGSSDGRELTGTPNSGNLILQVNQRDAADFAYVADNTQLWFVLRPDSGATPTRPDTATAATVLR
jgi:pilus assembly protein CpaB